MRASSLALALGLLLFATFPLPAQSAGEVRAVLISGPEVGHRAPDFTLPWANREGVGSADEPYQLYRDRGKTVVITFYARDFTQTCTTELRTLAERYDSIFGDGVVVVAISADSVATHGRFASSLNLPFRLLSDPQQRVARKYGSYGSNGFPRHTVFVIGPDGKVKYRNMSFDPMQPKHYADLGAAIRTTRGS